MSVETFFDDMAGANPLLAIDMEASKEEANDPDKLDTEVLDDQPKSSEQMVDTASPKEDGTNLTNKLEETSIVEKLNTDSTKNTELKQAVVTNMLKMKKPSIMNMSALDRMKLL